MLELNLLEKVSSDLLPLRIMMAFFEYKIYYSAFECNLDQQLECKTVIEV